MSFSGDTWRVESFDAVVIGTGCAGAAMVQALRTSSAPSRTAWVGPFEDPAPRRISFWGEAPAWMEPCLDRRWRRMAFRAGSRSVLGQIPGQPYTTFRSDRLLAQVAAQLPREARFDTLARRLRPDSDGVTVQLEDGRRLRAPRVFCSVAGLLPQALRAPSLFGLAQSFFGFEVETDRPRFDPGVVTLMDFEGDRDDQFVYVLPFDERRALVEPTRIALDDPLDQSSAEAAAARWLGVPFRVLRGEAGRIPMVPNAAAPSSPRITAIGVAGGCRKPSSGYSFARSLRHIQDLVAAGLDRQVPPPSSARHRFLDRVFLRVLREGQLSPRQVFEALCLRGDFERLLRFLDEDTSLVEELPLLAALPIGPFLAAALGPEREPHPVERLA